MPIKHFENILGFGAVGGVGAGLAVGDTIISAEDLTAQGFLKRDGDLSLNKTNYPLLWEMYSTDFSYTQDSNNSNTGITNAAQNKMCYFDVTRSTWINVWAKSSTEFIIYLSDDFSYSVNARTKTLNIGASINNDFFYDEVNGKIFATGGTNGLHYEITIDFDTVANTNFTSTDAGGSVTRFVYGTDNYYYGGSLSPNKLIRKSTFMGGDWDNTADAIFDETTMETQAGAGSNFLLYTEAYTIILNDDTVIFKDIGNRKIYKSDTIVVGSGGVNSTIKEVFEFPALEALETDFPYIDYDGDNSLIASTNKQVWKSNNKGETWAKIFDMPTPDCDIVISIPQKNTYVVNLLDQTGYPGVVFLYTNDNGSTWTELPLSAAFNIDISNYLWNAELHNDNTTGDFVILDIAGDNGYLYVNNNVTPDNFTVPEIPRLSSMKWNEFYWIKAG